MSDDCGHPILETIGKMAVRIRQIERERDEARAAAREILLDSVSWDEFSYEERASGVWKAFPWLLEKK